MKTNRIKQGKVKDLSASDKAVTVKGGALSLAQACATGSHIKEATITV